MTLEALEALSAEQVLRLAAGLAATGAVQALGLQRATYEDGAQHVFARPHEVAGRLGLLMASLPTLRHLELSIMSALANAVRRRPAAGANPPPPLITCSTARLLVSPPPTPQGQEGVWTVLAQLRALPRLETLHACVLRNGDGLPQLAHAAPSLAPSLRALCIRGSDGVGAAVAMISHGGLDFIGALTRLERLQLKDLFSDLQPVSLLQLAALTLLDALFLCFSASRVAEALAPLRELRALSFSEWTTEIDAPLRGLPACGSVTNLRCWLRPAGAASLAAAFPNVQEAELTIQRDGSAPPPPPPPPGAPRWTALRRLDLVNHGNAPVMLRALQALGALGVSLRRLRVCACPYPGELCAGVGDAELLAILEAAPALEELMLPIGAVTDEAFARCPRRTSLTGLDLPFVGPDIGGQATPPRLSATGLLSLGAAFPALASLILGTEDMARAWARQLDALGGGAEGGGRASGYPQWKLLLAIRGALRRGAVDPAAPGPSASHSM